MPIPDYQSLFLPVLQGLVDGNDHSLAELRQKIAVELNLTPDDLAQRLPSGVQPVFTNRVAWSSVYLAKAGAIERTSRGVFKITPRGRELLGLGLPRLTVQELSRYPEFVAFRDKSRSSTPERPDASDRTETPEEQLANAYKVLRDALANELLETVKKVPPSFFEEIVVDLLLAMGYGGSIADAGQVVGRGGDGGIDGIIKEDKLGLDLVYIQAKRWVNSVGRPDVQAFAGSLEGVRARKGVFITTSYFSQEAKEYVKQIEKRIVLIDGTQLAELMIEHNVGVATSHTYTVKRIDLDYFEQG